MLIFVAAPKASAQPQNLRSYFAVRIRYSAPLCFGVSIVRRVHHEEDHNACKVDAIVIYDIRIDLMWVNKDNAFFTSAVPTAFFFFLYPPLGVHGVWLS